jgi:sRNA-binding carbon storage regulator CsrA
MLVLTRRVGESIVINNEIVVTVTGFNETEAHAAVSSTGGEQLRRLTIPKNGIRIAEIPRVHVVLVETRPDKIRLGIDAPHDMPIHLLENTGAVVRFETDSIPCSFPTVPPISPIRPLPPYSLWLGHAGHMRDVCAVIDAGIAAFVDLALNEPIPPVPRDLIYCRFPLIDGVGNNTTLLRAAIGTTAELLRMLVPTLVFCSVGSSRSPAIVAAAISVVSRRSPGECLAEVARSVPHDVSPGLWADILTALG